MRRAAIFAKWLESILSESSIAERQVLRSNSWTEGSDVAKDSLHLYQLWPTLAVSQEEGHIPNKNFGQSWQNVWNCENGNLGRSLILKDEDYTYGASVYL